MIKNNNISSLDIFIEGETIDLCVPSCDEYVLDQWYRWFNRSEVTKYLDQGVYPNTISLQREYCNSIASDRTRIVTLIRPKNQEKIIGVASLSSISYIKNQCDFAMVIGDRRSGKGSLFYGMEAKARLTQHAFDNVGVDRINSSQVDKLDRWQKWQILFGYQIEGILRNKHVKGSLSHNVYMSSCLEEDYRKIIHKRGGVLWPGKSNLLDMMRAIPDKTLIDELTEWLPEKQKKYWNTVFRL
jgi:hypothetical protein